MHKQGSLRPIQWLKLPAKHGQEGEASSQLTCTRRREDGGRRVSQLFPKGGFRPHSLPRLINCICCLLLQTREHCGLIKLFHSLAIINATSI